MHREYARLARRLGASLRGYEFLREGRSVEVARLDLDRGPVIARRPEPAGWDSPTGDVLRTEYTALRALHDAGLPVPEPLLLAPPYLVVSYLDGTNEIEAPHDAVLQMADFLLSLHALDLELDLPARDDPIADGWEYLSVEHQALVRDHDPRPNPSSILHGDFWSGNVLFQDGQLCGVIDWENVALGDPLADVAGCRVELLWQFDEEIVELFTERYFSQSTIDPQNLPFWELYIASAGAASMHEWGIQPRREALMRRKTDALLTRLAAQIERLKRN